MDFPLEFSKYTQWSALATVGMAVLAILAFVFGWGFRFRLVGVTGFFIVLTIGLFGLSLGLFNRTQVPGAVRFTRVYDNGGNQVTIAVPDSITRSELEATLLQAANDYYSLGRMGASANAALTIRARTLLHPQPGLTKPIYLGQVQRSAASGGDSQFDVKVFPDKLREVQKSLAS